MSQLVIAIHPDGSVETLLKDKVFDSRIFGNRKIERISEILPIDNGQKFYISWLRGPLAAQFYGLFDSYEEAVEYEISTVNNLRKQGYRFNKELLKGHEHKN